MAYNQDDNDIKNKAFIQQPPAKVAQPIPNTSFATGNGVVAPTVSKAQAPTPLNQSYNVMKGLMGMSNNTNDPVVSENINQQKTEANNNTNKEKDTYRETNTRVWQTPEQITADYEAYKIDPNSEGGQRYAKTLAGTTTAPAAPNFEATTGYINPNQIITKSTKGGSVGNKLLNVGLETPAQQRMRSMLVGDANQDIANNMGTGTTPNSLNSEIDKQNTAQIVNEMQVAKDIKAPDDAKAAEEVKRIAHEKELKDAADAATAKALADQKAKDDAKAAAVQVEINRLNSVTKDEATKAFIAAPSGALNMNPTDSPISVENQARTNVDASGFVDTKTPEQKEADRKAKVRQLMGLGNTVTL